MAFYDFSKTDKESAVAQTTISECEPTLKKRVQIFSSLATRLFFLLLLLADVLWIGYALIRMGIALIGIGVSGGKVGYFKTLAEKGWIYVRRSLVCGVSLLIALC